MPYLPNFNLPEDPHPEEYRCIVIPVPDDETYVRVFAGLISQMTQWFNWQRDEENKGKECAQEWRDIYQEIDWSGNMSRCGCCPDEPLMYRWTEDGHYQSSDDGGVTWIDAPTSDPRYSVPMNPPVLPEGTVEPDCTYADSAVNVLKVQFVEAIEVGDDLQAIIGIIIGVLSAVLGTIAAPLVYQIMAVVAGAILAFTIEAFQDAFTEEVWDRLRCNLLDNMGADGSFTSDQVDEVYSRIGSEETGIVYLVLRQAIAAFGAVGLTNAARSGAGAADAECNECDDTCDASDWVDYREGYTPFPGQSITYNPDNTISATGGDDGAGNYRLYLSYNATLMGDGGNTNVPHTETCWVTFTTDATAFTNASGSGESYDDRSVTLSSTIDVWLLEFTSSAPFEVTLTPVPPP